MDLTFAIAVTTHLGLAGDYNEIHPHVRFETGRVITGVYLNSEERLSGYLGLRFENDDGLFLELGLVTGYEYKDVLPYGRVGKDFDNFTLFATPAVEFGPERRIGVVVGVEYRF